MDICKRILYDVFIYFFSLFFLQVFLSLFGHVSLSECLFPLCRIYSRKKNYTFPNEFATFFSYFLLRFLIKTNHFQNGIEMIMWWDLIKFQFKHPVKKEIWLHKKHFSSEFSFDIKLIGIKKENFIYSVPWTILKKFFL